MFVGFIAVIVVILIVVALMSTGATSGSGGVDQTKATKAVSEISALGQSIGFFKTTTLNSNYAGINVDSLVKAGIISSNDVQLSTDSMKALPVTVDGVIDNTEAALVPGRDIIKSKAVEGLYYEVLPGASASTFVIKTIINEAKGGIAPSPEAGGADDSLRSAIEAAVAKLDGNGVNVKGGGIDVVSGTKTADGLVVVTLK